MPPTSPRPATKRPSQERPRNPHWKRVGAFVRKRREELGLTQREIIRTLGYVNPSAVTIIEQGREGLPLKRIYAWAEILQVPRDSFFRFVTGATKLMGIAKADVETTMRLTPAELALIAAYRRLTKKYRQRLEENAREYQTLVENERRSAKRR